MTDHNLLVSIIVPLIDHRDQYMESIKTFCEQSLEKGTYEVIVVCMESAPEIEEITTAYPDVRIVFSDEYSDHVMFNTAIADSFGKYLYLTECHCFATPDCVAKAIEEAENHGIDCVNSNSTGANVNKFAEMEQRLYDIDKETWKNSTRAKISVRGFLISHDSWNEVGGFPIEFGHFSELMLGKKLQDAGKKFAYADQSIIAHYNQPHLKTLIAELKAYGFHECHSNHHDPPDEEKFLCEEWQWYRDAPAKVPKMIQRHQRRLRWLSTVLRLSPVSAPWFCSYHRELWETSIRVGRLNYLTEMVKSVPTPLSLQSKAA